ncbi:MAG: DNA mismatch repair protein MutS [Patescibacteria group bacterium]|jgi:DNA mismatch repair protein MutS
MGDFATPMMQQYVNIKRQYPDCLLFFRLGDFYEMFMDDAKVASEILDITLTGRDRGQDGRIPMAGVPFHSVNSYISKLVRAGYKVAICEQVSDPSEKGLVDREVIRVVTPGTLFDEDSLDRKTNNFIVSVSIEDKFLGLALADVSTGDFFSEQFELGNLDQILADEFAKYSPSECILSYSLYGNAGILKALKAHPGLNVFPFEDYEFFSEEAERYLKTHFGVATLSSFGLDNKEHAQKAAAALLGYLKRTQKDNISHIKGIRPFRQDHYVGLDRSTILNLELFSQIRSNGRKGSLIDVLDRTITAMGGRMLKVWLLHPLTSAKEISERYDTVEIFHDSNNVREELAKLLENIADIERLLSRLSVGVGNARDLLTMKNSLDVALALKRSLAEIEVPMLKGFGKEKLLGLEKLVEKIGNVLVDDPPVDLKGGGLIRSGVDTELDSLRDRVAESKVWVAELEEREKVRTKISSLKVRFNQVFGYYIEITKSNLHLAPEDYIRKQTLVNAERYITPDLKHHEEIILTTKEKTDDLEYSAFRKLVEEVLKHTQEIQKISRYVATVDCLFSFSELARAYRYIRPQLLTTGEINIKEGRHAVVERFVDSGAFVPNDTFLNTADHQLLVLTGPNMSGKSVYIRQVALIVLMAQIGSFVPAASAKITPVDKIFVRSGASDLIASGLSTFMVEMVETANILNNATSDSLIVMDEIGRGTSTYDGISISKAIAEFLVTRKGVCPKTLFATHYHELQALAGAHPQKIRNYQVLVEESSGDPVFLHKVVPGGADHSYGIAVAKIAGIPKEVIEKASSILSQLEVRDFDTWLGLDSSKQEATQAPDNPNEHAVLNALEELDLDKVTPLEALNVLVDLKKKAKAKLD